MDRKIKLWFECSVHVGGVGGGGGDGELIGNFGFIKGKFAKCRNPVF